MLCTDIPELSDTSIRFLETSLCLKAKNSEEVTNYLASQFEDALESLSTRIMFAIHVIAN